MKASTTALQQFLVNAQTFWMADLYTITLSGGMVLRYTGAGKVVTYAGNTFLTGPRFVPQGIKQQRGIQTDTVEIDLYADSRHTINGVPIITLAKNKGFDKALFKIERAFAPDANSAIVGTAIRFSGRLSEIQDGGAISVRLMLASGLEVLDVNMPTDLYNASCLNTLYDSLCGVNKNSFMATGALTSGPITASSFPTNLAPAAGTYVLGTVAFTSGVNSGVQRSVKSQDASGNFVFNAPFPATPSPGDTFNAFLGCNLSIANCTSPFNNLINFRGQPFIPNPSTILGGVGSTATSSANAVVNPTGAGNVSS